MPLFVFAFLAVVSLSMCTTLERVLPRQVNLSTAFSFCPFTVLASALFGFAGAS